MPAARRIPLIACACAGALLLAGCGSTGGLLPAQSDAVASPFSSYDSVVTAFEQIVPGQTRIESLGNIGFDARTQNVEVLSYLGIESRFLPSSSVSFERLDPAVQACIRAELACSGYVFQPQHSASKRIGNTLLDIFGFERVTRSEKWSAEILLLVQNGIVTHKLFSGSPRSENIEDKVQPLGPLQNLGDALLTGARAAGSL